VHGSPATCIPRLQSCGTEGHTTCVINENPALSAYVREITGTVGGKAARADMLPVVRQLPLLLAVGFFFAHYVFNSFYYVERDFPQEKTVQQQRRNLTSGVRSTNSQETGVKQYVGDRMSQLLNRLPTSVSPSLPVTKRCSLACRVCTEPGGPGWRGPATSWAWGPGATTRYRTLRFDQTGLGWREGGECVPEAGAGGEPGAGADAHVLPPIQPPLLLGP
jgi:hypothetical protein